MKNIRYILVIMLGAFLLGCGQTNLFDGLHSPGSDKSPEALNADAQVALVNKDYTKAEQYFSEVIQKDPNNSVALYGLAQAAYGKAGIKLATLLSSAVADAEPSNAPDYSLVNSSRLLSPGGDSTKDLIPIEINLDDFYQANKIVIPSLKVIADGRGDGTIPTNDPDVNINLAIAQALQAALIAIDSNANEIIMNDPGQIIDVKQDYSVDYSSSAISSLNDEEKEVFKKQVVKAMVYLIGSTKTDTIISTQTVVGIAPSVSGWRGAVDYLLAAINHPELPASSVLADLREELLKFAGYDGDTGLNDLKKLWNEI